MNWTPFHTPKPRQVNSLIPLERIDLDEIDTVGNGCTSFLTNLGAARTPSQLELQAALAECEMLHGLVRHLNATVIFGETGSMKRGASK